MANVVNPETESITLNTTLETPTLDPATELEQLTRIDQPSRESTSNPEAVAIAEAPPLDADALTEPVVEAAREELSALAPEAELPPPAEAEPAPPIAAETVAPAPEAHAAPEPGEDFSAALAAFEREQAA